MSSVHGGGAESLHSDTTVALAQQVPSPPAPRGTTIVLTPDDRDVSYIAPDRV